MAPATRTRYYMTHIVVEGVPATHGFPVDMLRYDSCCPEDEVDSRAIDSAIDSAIHQRAPRKIQIKLRRFSPEGTKPNRDRWASYGWTVL